MSESDEQKMIISWFRLQYPKYKLIAIPNGQWIAGTGGKKFALINKYKAEGLTNGVSDLFLCVARNGYHGLWIEMKDKGKTQCSVSADQKQWIKDMGGVGYAAIWAAGFDEAKEFIERYLNG